MQWPIDSVGIEPEDLPYGYSYYPTIWDDKRGYDAVVISVEPDRKYLPTILLALSPGAYVSATLVSEGTGTEQATALATRAVGQFRATVEPAGPEPVAGPQAPSQGGRRHREAQ